MCPIFSNYPLEEIALIGEPKHKNPWADDAGGNPAAQSRTLLKASEDGNILCHRAHFGVDGTMVHSGDLDKQYEIETPLRIGLLPRFPVGPLRLGGVEGKYIFFKHLNLRFNFRYEAPQHQAITSNPGKNAYLPPMKVSIMIVKQRKGDVGEKYKQSIQKLTEQGNQEAGGAGRQDSKLITGPCDFLGDNLLMDPLGQPFGVGKWHRVKNQAGVDVVLPDESVNGTRNGAFYFQCPVQRKWFTVMHSRTFIMAAPKQPNIGGASNAASLLGWNQAKQYPTAKTVSFSMPIKTRMLMKSLGANRYAPEGAYVRNQTTSIPPSGIPTGPLQPVNQQQMLPTQATAPVPPSTTWTPTADTYITNPGSAAIADNPTEWLAPADVDMSEYKVVVKAYSYTETPATNKARLSSELGGAPPQLPSWDEDGPQPQISYTMTGRMSYNDV